MTDPAWLARLPEIDYESKMAVFPADDVTTGPGVRLADDGRLQWVLLDADGPGVVTSLWARQPERAGRAWLEVDDQPPVAMNLATWLGGRQWPFVAPLAGPMGAGRGSRFPIPFERHCAIVTESPPGPGWVAWRRYPTGTAVEPLTAGLTSK